MEQKHRQPFPDPEKARVTEEDMLTERASEEEVENAKKKCFSAFAVTFFSSMVLIFVSNYFGLI